MESEKATSNHSVPSDQGETDYDENLQRVESGQGTSVIRDCVGNKSAPKNAPVLRKLNLSGSVLMFLNK